MGRETTFILPFDEVGRGDLGLVGGKNASLGEMYRALQSRGVRVPNGFAVTASAYRAFLAHNDLVGPIEERLAALDEGRLTLQAAGGQIRGLFGDGGWPEALREEIVAAYRDLSRSYDAEDVDVAVRSSATAEDLPEASFAGQQESYLNVSGEDSLLQAVRACFASLFTDRAITYRQVHGFEHMKVFLSVGVQRMVRSDTGAAGVAFTVDTETGFPGVVVINGAWGLGEYVVKGVVNPDEFRVFKPLLDRDGVRPILSRRVGSKERALVYAEDGGTVERKTSPEERARLVLDDEALLELASWCKVIEEHYDKPMDIEWALDGETGELFIVQARPETVQSRVDANLLCSYRLDEEGEVIARGVAVGNAIAAGKAFVLESMAEAERFEDGGVLVTRRTDPDWMPVMKRASAIVTDQGGRTSHAAIVSRELGVTAVVGCGDATSRVESGQVVTVDGASGEEGVVYAGELAFSQESVELGELPETRTEVMLNVASPEAAMRWWRLPCDGVGLARIEFIIEQQVQVHPMALVHPERVEDEKERARIEELTAGYEDRREYFVDRLAEGVARIASTFHPKPVVVRTSDFKTNEYAQLVGGSAFEPVEENPMIGWRGASRYYSEAYQGGFELECRALARVRGEMGLDNVVVMLPFCRTLEEADQVLEVMAANGLARGEGGLEVYVMAEIPSNIVLTEEFAERFDGFSVGSNDLTQLTLGVDRDSALLAGLFDEANLAVVRSIEDLIRRAHGAGRHVGLCGQAPSDRPEFARHLVEAGIDAISVNPDAFVDVVHTVAEAEA